MKFPSLYFDWLQKDNPTGEVDKLPELKNKFDTSVDGIYCVGDLTGIPLIKLATETGHELMNRLANDSSFARQRKENTDDSVQDLLIVGAGPAGLSAAIRAKELEYRFQVIESSQVFNTIVNFPAGKPIYVTPEDPPFHSNLKFSEGTKETLLDELRGTIQQVQLPIHEGEMVQSIDKQDSRFVIKTRKRSYRALRVIIAIGKSGNARMLDVPGEKLPKVFTRLIDPNEHQDEDILVVGGGDSAIEAANALAESGNRVTLSYRRATLSRPKEHNVSKFNRLVEQEKITVLFESTVAEIKENEVVLNIKEGQKTLPNQAVYALIGTEIPVDFFKRSGIRMEGEKKTADWVKIAALLLFSSVLYFGKKAPVTTVSDFMAFLTLPGRLLEKSWPAATKGMFAWGSFVLMAASGGYLVFHLGKNVRTYFSDAWNGFKHSYFILAFLLFGYIYISHNLRGDLLLGAYPGTWYTALYSLTIVVFGIARIRRNPTGYIKRQTYALMAFQVIPLFILPVFVFPWMGENGLLNDWVMREVFPGKAYWRSYGFILAWPLFVHNLATGQPTIFWLVVALAQSFLIIPLINVLWGKGAYCGWVCSCGALAETLGDEYRTKAPHGPGAKKLDNVGQVVLWFAILMTAAVMISAWGGVSLGLSSGLQNTYDILVDIFFAGVLGLGVYFVLSGRFWCRVLCPLAALMHIYTRFSFYRIMSNKKRCISCNICTKVCHMGIDVMGYANKGVPMNDVECVRCSACIVNCPMQVLTFGKTRTIDMNNNEYKDTEYRLTPGWPSGLPKEDIEMLQKKEKTTAK